LEVEVGNLPAGEPSWKQALCDSVRELCRVSVDSVVLLPPGSLPVDGRMMADERKWE
jgi:hypothetical protein